MRLHHLEIQAFGPFGGSVEVDFDDLNASGQFLISGATGSGKTFILDAICFALYGEVPGERQRAKHLRSDHAATGLEPRVTLTLTVAHRHLRVTRSPAWDRPKRRGVGTTLQQASVRLEQAVDGEWTVLATRLDEAGHLINTWLGMTPTQFTQVALLPQGGFQTFLHAPSSTRQEILQRLFRTDRFERVEKWFGDLRRSLNRARVDAEHQLDLLVHRLSEATQTAAPVDRGTDAVIEWAIATHESAAEAERESGVALAQAQSSQDDASNELSNALRLAEAHERGREATAALRELDETEPEFTEALRALENHQRAVSLQPLIRARHDAADVHKAAFDDYDEALATAALDRSADVRALVDQAAHMVADAEHAQVLARSTDQAQVDLAAAEARSSASTAALREARAAASQLPAALAAVSAQVADAAAADLELVTAVAALEVANAGLAAAEDLQRIRADVVRLQAQHTHDVHELQDLRQAYLDAREARIDAMASELAIGLVAGCSCPVCGSTAHPSPAASASGSGKRREERARRAYETAGVEVNALAEVIAGLLSRVTSLESTTEGRSVAQWTRQRDEAVSAEKSIRDRAEALGTLQNQQREIQAHIDRARAELEALIRDEATTSAAVEQAREVLECSSQNLARALGEYSDAQVFHAAAVQHAACLQAVLDRQGALNEAETVLARHAQAVDQQAQILGFESTEAAEGSALSPADAAAIAEQSDARIQARLAAEATLSDPDVAAIASVPLPDLGACRLRAEEAETHLNNVRALHEAAVQRAQRAGILGAELQMALANYRPLEEKSAQVTALSGLLEGTGSDNRVRMRLSAYVLAERLRQVVAAANARLQVISEGRYVLRYREERGAGDSRGGLSLSVLDEWTGVERDPTTLSGGETFVVSLCLALGLADTVADESGGLRVETLFIDEGFGSLDSETLDSVIDILSQLSQGGRVTGIVSHVQELRERLPAALVVTRTKAGSTVRRASA